MTSKVITPKDSNAELKFLLRLEVEVAYLSTLSLTLPPKKKYLNWQLLDHVYAGL